MKDMHVNIRYPQELLLSLKVNKKQFEKEARFLLALKLYELGKISPGKAAELAGLGRVEFLFRLKDYGVSPFQESLKEAVEEARR